MVNILNNNPFINWLRWFLNTTRLLYRERKKNLKIGYLSFLHEVQIGKFNTFYDHVTVLNSQFDNFVYVGIGTRIINASIGKFVSIGGNVKIGLGKHPPYFISTFPAFFSTRKQCQISFTDKDYYVESESIKIGNDVWIAENVIIMDNIKIGDGAIIAAGAVVVKDVEPYTIVGGVPAKLIGKRFTDEQISLLLNFKWWEKDIWWIKENYVRFNTPELFFNEIILK